MRIIHCSEMATNKGKSSRGRSCVAGGPNGESCKNTQYTQDVSIHTFPNRSSQPSRHMQWVKFVRRHRPGWQASHSSILCSVHFNESSFTMRQDLARELGIKAILKPDFFHNSPNTTPLQNSDLAATLICTSALQ